VTGKALRAAALCAALALVAACGEENAGAPPGVIQLSDAFSAEFALVDEDGAPVTDEDFAGRPMLVYFGYTHCPDVCPAALGVMSASLDELGADAAKVTPLFVTVDPERDTPARMKAHLAFDPRIEGLTGEPEQVDAALENFRVYAERQEAPESAIGYLMDHVSLFYIVDANGEPTFALRDTSAPADVAAAVRSVL